jgi:hypothetical protein
VASARSTEPPPRELVSEPRRITVNVRNPDPDDPEDFGQIIEAEFQLYDGGLLEVSRLDGRLIASARTLEGQDLEARARVGARLVQKFRRACDVA